jgi:glucosamine kinase
MILIADSGSTKADWKILHPSGEVTSQSTRGFNPFIQNAAAIELGLLEDFDNSLEKSKAETVYYYGAGCSDDYRNSIVATALKSIFPNAKIIVNHDLLASARAVCGTEAGVACILGTGSNSCLYDGIEIIDNVKNMGFLVGDEGSGSHIGKELLRGYFYREMPKDILADFDKTYPEGQRGILDKIYDMPKPNVYLASFSRFLSSHKGHPYIQHLVFKSFDEFTRRHVLKYDGCQNLKIHFVGSVAYYFKDILEIVLASYDLEIGNVIKKPIDRLVEFHQKIVSK